MSEDVEEERTDPSIELPDDDEDDEEVVAPPPRMSPLPPPPLPPSRQSDTDRPSVPAWPTPTTAPRDRAPVAPPPPGLRTLPSIGRAPSASPPRASAPRSSGPPRPLSTVPPGAVATPIRAASDRAASDRSPPVRASLSSADVPSRPPPPLGRESRPPSHLPKPSDPPPAARELSPPQRQRIAQMETVLDQARSAMARQRHEIDELRTQLSARERRLDALIASFEGAPTRESLEAIVSDAEERRRALARELRDGVESATRGAEAVGARFEGLEARLAALEEGSEMTRVRMRLERVGHEQSRLEGRLSALEARQDELAAAIARASANAERIERLESLFEELGEEVREQREQQDLEGLRARVDDVETLVVKASGALEAERQALAAQLARLEERASVAEGDELTRIKGVGPKFARLLREAGVCTFADVAAWTDEDIARMADVLGISPARIHKAGWVESAQKIVAG